jgi:hypothetical protein
MPGLMTGRTRGAGSEIDDAPGGLLGETSDVGLSETAVDGDHDVLNGGDAEIAEHPAESAEALRDTAVRSG